MRIFFLFIIALFAGQIVFAQATITENFQEKTIQPNIVQNLRVNHDPRLDKMVNWHIEKNKKINGVEGFRVEIFFNSGMDALELARNKKVAFLSKYPDYSVNIKYDAPNFKVRVGDFRTKNEALKLLKTINRSYPMAFIVPDIINFPLLKTKNYE
ncbi:MAG: SPOR domain-containing protein [Draconibacterium sp.]|nr:SPOR domain-containing protein [Draconibacterium sp.]